MQRPMVETNFLDFHTFFSSPNRLYTEKYHCKLNKMQIRKMEKRQNVFFLMLRSKRIHNMYSTIIFRSARAREQSKIIVMCMQYINMYVHLHNIGARAQSTISAMCECHHVNNKFIIVSEWTFFFFVVHSLTICCCTRASCTRFNKCNIIERYCKQTEREREIEKNKANARNKHYSKLTTHLEILSHKRT